MKRTSYGFGKELALDFDAARVAVEAALKEQGFGVLTEIDVQATLKKKLDVDFRRYQILGACNPPFAHRALSAEIEIGLLLPCNVIIYEDDAGKTHVMAIDPAAAMSMVDNPDLAAISKEVRERLWKAMEAVA